MGINNQEMQKLNLIEDEEKHSELSTNKDRMEWKMEN